MVDAYESDLSGGVWLVGALACIAVWWAMFFSAWGAIA